MVQWLTRRRWLTTAMASSGLAMMAGCNETSSENNGGKDGDGENDSEEDDNERFPSSDLNESVTYADLRVMVSDYRVSEDISVTDEGDLNLSEGSVGVIAHLHVENVGDAARDFPSAARTDGSINGFYNGESVNTWFHHGAYVIDGTEYQTFGDAAYQIDDTPSYPGTEADGWVAFQLAQNFDEEVAGLTVTWGPENQERRLLWTLTE